MLGRKGEVKEGGLVEVMRAGLRGHGEGEIDDVDIPECDLQ